LETTDLNKICIGGNFRTITECTLVAEMVTQLVRVLSLIYGNVFSSLFCNAQADSSERKSEIALHDCIARSTRVAQFYTAGM
jgi:hypothetical protein